MRRERIKHLTYVLLILITFNDLKANTVIDSLKTQLTIINDNEECSFLCRTIGDKYFQENKDSILVFYDKAMEYALLSDTHKDDVNTLRGYSYYHNTIASDYKKAREYSERGITLSELNKDDYNIALIKNDLGIIAWKQGDYIKATEYYFAADEIASRLDDANLRMRTQLSLGVIHNEAARNEEAEKYYKEALALAKICGHQRAQGVLINNLGKVYRDLEDYSASNSYFEEGLSVFTKMREEHRQSLSHYNLGYNNLLEKKYQKAIAHFETAFELNKAYKDKSRSVMILSGLAETYEASKQDNKAIQTALKGLDILEQIDTKLFRVTLNLVLARSYERQGNFQKAALYFKENIDLEEEEATKSQEKELIKMQAIHENERRLSQINQLKIQNSEETAKRKNTTYAFIFSIALFLFCLAFLVMLFYRTKLKQLEKYDKLRTKLTNDLHDNVGSSLNQVKILAEKLNRKNTANEQTSSSILRIKTISNDMISNMHDLIWSIDKDKTSLDDLIDRMRDHVSNVFSPIEMPYRMQVGEHKKNIIINSEVKNNIYSVFKEAINNIVKHARPEITKIKVDVTENVLTLRIENDKKEILENQYSNKRGLKSMEERATELGGKLDIKNEADKFVVTFKAKLS